MAGASWRVAIAMIATSYPEFFDHMATLGADVVTA